MKTLGFADFVDNVEAVDNFSGKSTQIWRNKGLGLWKRFPHKGKKYPHFSWGEFTRKNVDIVDNYLESRFSPIFSTSPAPIVINMSPFMQFFNKKFSISSKEGK